MTNELKKEEKPKKKNLAEGKLICLNVGCGMNPIPHNDKEFWVNIDKINELGDYFKTDKRYKDKKITFMGVNLDTPQHVLASAIFKSFIPAYGKFDRILMRHIFEHLRDPLKVMNDVWLICKKGALIEITCPYQGGIDAWGDLDHRREVNELMLLSLTDEFVEDNIKQKTSFTPNFISNKYSFHFGIHTPPTATKIIRGNVGEISIILKCQ